MGDIDDVNAVSVDGDATDARTDRTTATPTIASVNSPPPPPAAAAAVNDLAGDGNNGESAEINSAVDDSAIQRNIEEENETSRSASKSPKRKKKKNSHRSWLSYTPFAA